MKDITLNTLAPVEACMRLTGENLLKWRGDEKARVIHSKSEMKLEADRRAHDMISTALNAHFPDIPVISEEDASHSIERPELYWLIDPIDGTASWYDGFYGFVTQVALLSGSDVLAGMVFAPATDLFFMGIKGQGAWLNDTKLDSMLPRESMIITDNTPAPHGIAQTMHRSLEASGYVESGSLGLKSCLIASGDADLFIKDVVVRDWDMAPAWGILQELGAVMLNFDGTAYEFSGSWEKPNGFLVARNDTVAQRALVAINSMVTGEETT